MDVKKVCKELLRNWIAQEDGSGLYKYSGRYWEILYPLLQKHAPEELKQYEKTVGEEFNYFNEDVQRRIDKRNDEKNLKITLEYINSRIDNYSKPSDVDYIELPNEELLPYVPNQNIDVNQHFGREENEEGIQ